MVVVLFVGVFGVCMYACTVCMYVQYVCPQC